MEELKRDSKTDEDKPKPVKNEIQPLSKPPINLPKTTTNQAKISETPTHEVSKVKASPL